MRSDIYQYSLIGLGVVSTVLFGVFWYRELFPEYKIYQKNYVELENFRSEYTHEPPPLFSYGVKQVVFEREDKGPPVIDRCTSCHVALQFPHFSPTKVAYDINGHPIMDEEGRPVLIPNENYIWSKIDQTIESLSDPKANEELTKKGEDREVRERLAKANHLKSLKTAQVGDHIYDVTKVLKMHPLMGRETRPFEFHPVEEYGCTVCHNGNGRGLTTEKAHGPVFDGQYETEFRGHVPIFTEKDPENDPLFAKEFNSKPGHELLFQTTPIFVGPLIQAKCMNCHQTNSSILKDAAENTGEVAGRREKISQSIALSLEQDKVALTTLITLYFEIENEGLKKTLETLHHQETDASLPVKEQEQSKAQYASLSKFSNQSQASEFLTQQINAILGSEALTEKLLKSAKKEQKPVKDFVEEFLVEQKPDSLGDGIIFNKMKSLELEEDILRHINDTQTSFEKTVNDQKTISALVTDIDTLTQNYHRGEQLYLSQACYACHRIAGMARGGVGPELTRIGTSYPWYIKESIVWPQADLPTSTMPNYRLDHQELEDLMTFLLAQTGNRKAISDTTYKVRIQEWEAGKKLPWEKPATPKQMHDLRYGMTVFATEGCSACHRLKGFESNVGFTVEKDPKVNWSTLFQAKEWFKNLIPETITGSELVAILEKQSEEIDAHIAGNVRNNGLIEEIDRKIPGQVESFYPAFKFAKRAKNSFFNDLAAKQKDPAKKKEILREKQKWQDRVHKTLMIFIQEYGFGRIVGPRPNWSGVYRTDEWLMEHFRNPQSHIPRSIMPVLPFDDSKFYALTFMLDQLGKKNRDELRTVWKNNGFNPQEAYQTLCSQCHGPYLQGNGPVSEWIYPIPKNLRNTDFLRNLTKERVIFSLKHGVQGTPMPPWGEVAKDKPDMDHIPVLTQSEIDMLAEWLFSSLPGGKLIKNSQDVPKWNYSPKDVLQELQDEGNTLNKENKEKIHSTSAKPLSSVLDLFTGEGYLASITPVVAANTHETDSADSVDVSNVFDTKKNPPNWPDKYSYYIKKEYYTTHNIEQGKAFFAMNCAACHGAEADGTGIRASAMKDAKPRMLTNLDWGNNRDDLRLLRSIKYGVPGTAMNPWGDLTSSLQRLQLVIYIRTLTNEPKKREELTIKLYEAYEHALLTIEKARLQEYQKLEEAQKDYEALQNQRIGLYENIDPNIKKADQAVHIYQKEIEKLALVKKNQLVDQTLIKLKQEVMKERDLYQSLGSALLRDSDDTTFDQYLKFLSSIHERFTIQEGKLAANFTQNSEEEEKKLTELMIEKVDQDISDLEHKKTTIEGQIYSNEKLEALKNLEQRIDSNKKLKTQIINTLSEAKRTRAKQHKLYEAYIRDTKKEKQAS